MEKISIKKLIDFRSKSERSKKAFASNLKQDKKSENSSGGDYWISCLSTIGNIFKSDNLDLLNDKIELLQDKIENTEFRRTKSMFQRNIDILYSFEDFDFNSIRPNKDLNFHKKPGPKSIININGLPIQARPHHVFSFSNNDNLEVGAVWFVAKLDGYKKGELGMFTDILFRYLNKNFSEDYTANPYYCIAIDVFSGQKVDYVDIQKEKIPILLDVTIDEILKSR